MKQIHTQIEKQRSLRSRKQTFKLSFKKGVFHPDPRKIISYLNDLDIVVRVHSKGDLDDGTGFLQITIEGIKQ